MGDKQKLLRDSETAYTELRQAVVGLDEAATALPEASFATGEAARNLFDGTGAQHYREHAEQIRGWRQKERV